jgi:DNA-binding NarL/FixJ family response regulator
MATVEHSRCIVLTADDDEFFRIALRSILTKQLRVDEVIDAGSFDDALERLAERPDISLALFDLQMPGMKSTANLKTVRESFPTVRVGVVSASQNRQDVMAALIAGVHGYVPKSLGVAELGQAIGLILQGVIFVPRSLADVGPDASEQPSFSKPGQAHSLTPRQRQVLQLLVAGKSNKEIARTLELGIGTIKIHMAALFRNLDVANRASAAVVGARLLSAEPNLSPICV